VILWRRLDTPGHDACVLSGTDVEWQLDGTAVFSHEGAPARLTYSLACDRAWRARRGQVTGWIGTKPISFDITRSNDGVWTRNGAVVLAVKGCVDLDLGFTPATNLSQIRRLGLAEGQGADATVAWLDVTSGALRLLGQWYERRSESTYWYEAPQFNYTGLLEVSPAGFVRRYPGLWEVDEASDPPPDAP
jgi:hypothetical protein